MKQKKKAPNKIPDYSKILEPILEKRIGGAVNIAGIYYQVMYACWVILRKFSSDSDMTIQLEGIEDIDIGRQISVDNEYIQLKSSKNQLDANKFWELGVLQNYLEVYAKEPKSRFRLVYNMNIADGNLKDLIDGNLNDKSRQYWIDKFESLPHQNIDYSEFIKTVSFEYAHIEDITKGIIKLLYEKWHINIGTEKQYLTSLFFHTLTWSKDRTQIREKDVFIVFQKIADSFSKAPINEAIANVWIKPILFSDDKQDYSSYYDGKAALPIHIAQQLPVRRISWENKIETLLNHSDTVIVRSSSGQGKSTLAWQVCYNRRNDYNIYQVQYCPDFNSANSILQFIQSRLKIGQLPMIIFDGLNSSVQGWHHVVEGSVDLPVKFIITTSNEDWHRYASNVSRSNIQLLDIYLSKEEAKSVYGQLQKKGKLNINDNWQAVWEKVRESGLLIEYTYLLTKGEMIRDRLKHQIFTLNKTEGSAAKLEILRIVSLADSMNIKVRKQNLLKHVADNIGFRQDRGEVLNELTNEYFLSFERTYIGGLHPVRSNHLIEILHENLPIEDSLIALFDLLDDVYFPDYFINVPIYLNLVDKGIFYDKIGTKLSSMRFNQMVIAMDGVFHLAPQLYWDQSKSIYDEAFDIGSVELFAMTTIPFSKETITQLDELSNKLGNQSVGLQRLLTLAKQLPKFTIEETDLYILASSIQKHLKKRVVEIDSFIGFGILTKWFKELNISIEINPQLLSKIKIEYFFDNIDSFELGEAKEIVSFYSSHKKDEYLRFSFALRQRLLSYLKKATDSLEVIEKGNEVHINYLLRMDDVAKVNEMSVCRIQSIYCFLPTYERYCTEAVMLPFPSEEFIAFTKDSSIKRMPPENIVDEFDVHLNQIWYTTILKNYESCSVYDWQKCLIDLRGAAVMLVLTICRAVDASLEGNEKKYKSSLKTLEKYSTQFHKDALAFKLYPSSNKRYYEYNKRPDTIDEINSWLSSIRNVNNQLVNFFTPKEEHDRHRALYNLKDAYLSLSSMQENFNSIAMGSFEYFDTTSLEMRENELYERLYITMQYYMSKIPLKDKPAVRVAKNVAKEWWHAEVSRKMLLLRDILHNSASLNGYQFHLPSRLEETSGLTFATIGVEGLDWSDGRVLEQLSIDLVGLADFPADFFSVLNVQNGVVKGGLRFKQDFFKALNAELNNETTDDTSDLMPLPIFPDEKSLQSIDGLTLPPLPSEDSIADMKFLALIELWKLHEYSQHLNVDSEIENTWLNTIKAEIVENTNRLLFHVDDVSFVEWVKEGIKTLEHLSMTIIVNRINEIVQAT